MALQRGQNHKKPQSWRAVIPQLHQTAPEAANTASASVPIITEALGTHTQNKTHFISVAGIFSCNHQSEVVYNKCTNHSPQEDVITHIRPK